MKIVIGKVAVLGVLGLFVLGTGCKSAAEKYADEVCACSDKNCVDEVSAKYEGKFDQKQPSSGDKQAAERAVACVAKVSFGAVGVPTTGPAASAGPSLATCTMAPLIPAQCSKCALEKCCTPPIAGAAPHANGDEGLNNRLACRRDLAKKKYPTMDACVETLKKGEKLAGVKIPGLDRVDVPEVVAMDTCLAKSCEAACLTP